MATRTKRWITGEEYNAERRRLLEAGYDYPDAPEFQALMGRVAERNRYLFEKYGRPLIGQHPGKWIAISIAGDTVIGDREAHVHGEARERFGPGNFCLAKLTDPPGPRLHSPRIAGWRSARTSNSI